MTQKCSKRRYRGFLWIIQFTLWMNFFLILRNKVYSRLQQLNNMMYWQFIM